MDGLSSHSESAIAGLAPKPAPGERESALRQRLGIPGDAERVILFAESSHWDPNWLLTSEEYFRRFVGPNLDRALDELLRQPRRVYSIECVFFLRMYWERRPEQRDTVRDLVNQGRLRLTSSGVTTADTLLPTTEVILRDLLLGQEWLRGNGMTQEPRLAYFPDSFGHSPALPSILKAAGFDMAAITRIDGMYFAGADFEKQRHFPRPGSSAARLMRDERSLDFIWRGPDGAEVLCHWNAHTYGQGDMIAHRGLVRFYLFNMAVPDRSDRNVARKIERFVSQLSPFSRTRYLFCPIGFDFVGPIPGLVGLLDRYNRVHYPRTGVWALNAGLDDYLALVDCHRDRLPALELDPNPYWTGFYTSRPTLKKQCHDLVDRLLIAERLALLPGSCSGEQPAANGLEHAWWDAAVSNHHDFITGTSPDHVVDFEQRPWLRRAAAEAGAVIERLAPDPGSPEPNSTTSEGTGMPEWHSRDDRIEVSTPHYALELAEEAGGGIVRAWDPADGKLLLAAVSNDLVSYEDSGGLWRMGHEFRGGSLREISRASDKPSRLQVSEHDGGLEISCATNLEGETIRRRLRFRSDSPLVWFRVEGRAAQRHTVTVRFAVDVTAGHLVMDAAGGVVSRPPLRWYDPTFWPVQSIAHVQDDAGRRGIMLCLTMPGALSYRPGRSLELIALRNATRERAFGLLPLPGMPVTGREDSTFAFEYALLFTRSEGWRDDYVEHAINRRSPWDPPDIAARRELAESVVTTDRTDVAVIAAKPASRGDGITARLYTLTAPGAQVAVRISDRPIKAAFLCDARERDLEALTVQSGAARLRMPGTLATVRLLL